MPNTYTYQFPYEPNGYEPIIYGTGVGPGSLLNNNNLYPDTLKLNQAAAGVGPINSLITGQSITNTFTNSTIYQQSVTEYSGVNYSVAKQGIASTPDQGKLANDVLSNATIGIASGIGGAFASNFVESKFKKDPVYNLLRKDQLRLDGEGLGEDFIKNPILAASKYQDFRQRIPKLLRLDGASAALRGSAVGAAYAAASATIGGAYKIFNLETTYGFGNHGTSFKFQSSKDFTARTNVATRWNSITKRWSPTINPAEWTNEFLGDKVNVIDFGKRNLKQIYRWKPSIAFTETTFGQFLDPTDTTNDLVKFYFTGPKLHASSKEKDDVLVFRAIISSLTDSFNASWNPVQFIGRADPNYIYQGYQRQLDLNFTVYATARDEMKPMYRKLNYLASYTAPEYSTETIALKAPWLRITIGDLLVHQPVVLTSVYYTFADADTTWETNITQDPQMMQVPFKVDVSLQFNVVTDYLPQKNGRLYTLATEFDKEGQPVEGNRDWLSDQVGRPAIGEKEKFFQQLKRNIGLGNNQFRDELDQAQSD